VVGSRCGPFAKLSPFCARGKSIPTALITAPLPLAEADKAIQYAQKKGVMKVSSNGVIGNSAIPALEFLKAV